MSDTAERDECYAGLLPALFAVDPDRAATLTEERVVDPLVRDFVYLEVAREIDPGGGRWCERIQAQAVADRCRVLARRPHLQRELLGDRLPTGTPGGSPPPSGPGGPPPPGTLPGSGPQPTVAPAGP